MRPHLRRLINQWQQPDVWPLAVRRWWLRRMGAQVAGDAMVQAGCDVVAGPLSLGTGAFVNRGCVLEAPGGIAIGARAHLGFGVRVLTSTHAVGPSSCRAGAARTAPVTIGDGAWIGAGAIVLPGVSIGAGCVIAAGSVVTGDCTADTLYAGVPAVPKRSLD